MAPRFSIQRRLIIENDSTFTGAGTIGLWSKTDAQSHFDDLTLTSGKSE